MARLVGHEPALAVQDSDPRAAGVSSDRSNWGWATSAELTHGIIAIGIPFPMPSATTPTIHLSVIPSAQWFTVLKVAGATTIASARGHASGSPGSR